MSLSSLLTQGWNPANSKPSYATASINPFSNFQSMYNMRASNKRWVNRALGRVASGSGNFNVGICCDSLSTGYNGAVETRANSWPNQMMAELATLGFPSGGDGVVPLTDPLQSGQISAVTGTALSLVTKPFVSSTGAGTFTYTTLRACTAIEVGYSNLIAGFTWTIDGVAQAAGNVNLTSTLAKIRVTGLANQVHVMVFTYAVANVGFLYVGADSTDRNGFVHVNTLSNGGSQVANGTFDLNWNDPGGLFYNLPNRLTYLPTTQDLWIVGPGGTDVENHPTPIPTVIAGFNALIAQLRTHSPNSDVMFINHLSFPDLENTLWPTWMNAVYANADANNLIVPDWNDRLGGYARALAMGMLGADNLHFTFATQAAFGRVTAQALVA